MTITITKEYVIEKNLPRSPRAYVIVFGVLIDEFFMIWNPREESPLCLSYLAEKKTGIT